jgi:3-hydroxyacyl-CoA dehydrogenase
LKLLIIGNEKCAVELINQIPDQVAHQIEKSTSLKSGYDIVFILQDVLPCNIDISSDDTLFIVCSVTATLPQCTYHSSAPNICGMNLLPGFISMPVKEVVATDAVFKKFCYVAESFNWKYKRVPDTPGMITLRVLSMIINEAASTIAEGTATIEDIDKGMMLGTNYPKGPLKWCDEIGVTHVVHTLQNLHASTGDNRYHVHPYLDSMYTAGLKFYSNKTQESAY